MPEIDAQLVKEAAISEEKDSYVVLMWDEMKILFLTRIIVSQLVSIHFLLVWEAVQRLEHCGFNVIAFCCDGASSNQAFYKMYGARGEFVMCTSYVMSHIISSRWQGTVGQIFLPTNSLRLSGLHCQSARTIVI